jgi:transposase
MGVWVLSLPKFSPELNPIKQCWGFSKRTYREFPPSSTIKDLIQNTHDALASVLLDSIHKYMYVFTFN